MRIIYVFLFFFFSLGITAAQEGDTTNLTTYAPGTLLKQGQIEIKQFNNLYTQTFWYNGAGKKSALNERATYFTGFTDFLYGKSDRFNIGANAMLRSVLNDARSSSPLKIFEFEQTAKARTALTALGPQIRWTPVKKWEHISIQNRLFIPVSPDLQGEKSGRPWLDFDAYQLWNQFFYDKIFAERYVLFIESDIIFALNRQLNLSQSVFYTPLKILVGSFIGRKWGVYVLGEFGPYWGTSEIIATYYSQVGAGVKHQLTKRLELETLVTVFPLGKNSGAGQTFNIGIRYLR